MKKGKLALIVISGLIGISVIGNMLGASSDKANNNVNSKKQENESAKVEQKIEKTEEELKKEEEQKKREEEQKKREEEQKIEEKKKLEEKNKINTAIGAATAAAAITNRNNNREEVRQERPVEEKRKGTVTDRGQAKVESRAVPSTQPKVNSNVREVYITPNGKRYHYDPQCGGKNSYKVGINNVKGRTPCKKCVH